MTFITIKGTTYRKVHGRWIDKNGVPLTSLRYSEEYPYTRGDLAYLLTRAKWQLRKLRNIPKGGRAYETDRPFVEAKMQRCSDFIAKIDDRIRKVWLSKLL